MQTKDRQLSHSELRTLVHWAKIGTTNKNWQYKDYKESFPNREDPSVSVDNIRQKYFIGKG